MIITAEQLSEAMNWEEEKKQEFMREFFSLPVETQQVLNRDAGNPLGQTAIRDMEVLTDQLLAYREEQEKNPDPMLEAKIKILDRQICQLNDMAERFRE